MALYPALSSPSSHSSSSPWAADCDAAMSLPNANSREWSEIRQSLISSHVFGLAAYYQLTAITHRNGAKWDNQRIILPLTFLFFPLLYPCQIIVAIFLASRNCIWRPRQGLNYHLCAVLGMYAVRTSFVDPKGMRDDHAERRGYHLLSDIFKPRAHPVQKPWTGGRVFNICMAIVFLYQIASTLTLCGHRWASSGPTMLEIDHRIGLMAAGGLLSGLGYFFFELTGFDWEDTLCTDRGPTLDCWKEGSLHKGLDSHRHLADGLDTSNKYVYDCALALTMHILYLRFTGRCFPFFDRRYDNINNMSISVAIPYIILVTMGIPMMADVYWSSSARKLYDSLPGSSIKSRICIILSGLFLSIMTVRSEAGEIIRVNRGQTDALNADWSWKDPWSSFLWPL